MSIGQETLCREVEEALTDVLEGTASARLMDHLADCDVCRDLRYEAERSIELVSFSGADFEPSAGFADRMLESVELARPDGPQPGQAPASVVPFSVAAPRAGEPTRGSATEEAAPLPLSTAQTEFAEMPPSENQATMFEPGKFTDDIAEADEGRAKSAPQTIADPFVPTTKTMPLQAILAARNAENLTPAPSSELSAAPVDAVTGGNNTTASGAGQSSRVAAGATGGSDVGRTLPSQPALPNLDTKSAPRITSAKGPVAGQEKPAGGAVVRLFRRKGFVAALAGTMTAAAALGAYMVNKDGSLLGPKDGAVAETGWEAKAVKISRASSDGGEGGVEVCKNGCAPLAPGAAIEAGSTLRTDSKSRARISLGNGSWVAMDRNTELLLPAGADRQAKLERGMAVFAIETGDGQKPAKVGLPQGDLTASGTKVAVTVSDRRAAVEVVRGEVELTTTAGNSTKVRAGEEATVEGSGEPIVAAKASISDALAFSSEGEQGEVNDLRGLGELRAKKPGEQKERSGAVRLTKHQAKVRIVDVVARTEIDETFTNQTDDELEGIFRFPLPPDAQIERLALEVDGQLLDGAFVDRDRGAAIWRGVIQNAAPKTPRPREEIIWVPGPWRDPALLEWQRGGRFELKIFPIPKRSSRRVVLTYTQTVQQSGGIRRFTLPLSHDAQKSTQVDDFAVDVQVLGHDKTFGIESRGYQLAKADAANDGERLTMNERGFVPAGDLTVEYALPNRTKELTAWAYQMPSSQSSQGAATTAPVLGAAGFVGGTAVPTASTLNLSAAQRSKLGAQEARALTDDGSAFVALAVRPKLPRFPEGKERLHVIVVDSSRSMVGERFARARQLASSVVREMDRRDSFLLLACDTTCQAMGASQGRSIPAASAPSAETAQEVEKFLGSIDPEGGSNLLAAVQAARTAAGFSRGKELRVIYLGDGTPTVGPSKPAHLEAAVRHALPSGDGSVIAVALGADADTTSLSMLARGGNGVLVPYVPGQRVATAALDVLAASYGSVLSDVEVVLPAGLADQSPRRVDPIAAGGESFVFARMSGERVSGNVTVRGRVGNERFEQTYPIELVSSQKGGNAFVPRMFAAAKISELEKQGSADDRERIVELSKRFNVASRHTSLLVLESEAMFKAFGLDKNGIDTVFTGETIAESSSSDADGEEDARDAGDGFGAGEGRLGSLAKEESKAKKSAARPQDDELFAEAPSPDLQMPSGGGARGPAPAATAAPAPPPAKPSTVGSDPFGPGWNQPQQQSRPSRRRPPNMIPMRKVFDRKASFTADNALAQEANRQISELEVAMKASPDNRDRTVQLYKALMAAGRVGEAQELTAKWSERDALDPEALLARADLAAMSGDRSRAMRILSGLSDVRPGDKTVQRRLISAFTQLGAPDVACQHRLALADLDQNDVSAVGEAVRCSQDQGFSELSRTILASAPTTLRDRIESTSRNAKLSDLPTLLGDVRVTATWNAPVDLDLALVDKSGHRLSWLGSTLQNVRVSAQGANSTQSETLAVSGLGSGSFVVELVRSSDQQSNTPISGELTFTLPGGTVNKVPFTMTGNRFEAGAVRVFFTSRLVPVDQSFRGGGGWR